MALISCPECSHQVSDRASSCPSCGVAINPPIYTHSNSKPVVVMPRRGFICESCGDVGFPKTVVKGSILIELVLWLCFIIPGIIYSTWRLTTKAKQCPRCGGHMIPISTPRARTLAQQINPHVTIQ